MQEQNKAMSEIMGEILCNPGHARLFYILKFVPVGHEKLKDVIIRVRLSISSLRESQRLIGLIISPVTAYVTIINSSANVLIA
jgi:hypothetical protein